MKISCEIYSNTLLINTPIGIMCAEASNDELTRLYFLESSEERDQAQFISSNPILNQLHLELNQYFEGKRTEFTVVHAKGNTVFSSKIISQIKKVSFGSTLSYSSLAKNYGDVKSTRAVAKVNAENKLLIVVPCHRIIGANQELTGYSGDLYRKEWLLQHELKHSQKAYQTSLF